jgi:cell division control protein 6
LIRSFSGEAFENFDNILEAVNPQLRFSDMISFLDLYGLINARVVSMGRYGKTREIAGSLPERVVRGVVKL